MNAKFDNRSVRRTKAKFREALITLMSGKPIKIITVRELADMVDMNRGTFYFHYKDVFDFVECLKQEIKEDFELILNNYPETVIEDRPFLLMEDIFTYLAKNADLCRVMMSKNGDIEFIEQVKELIKKRLQNRKIFADQKKSDMTDFYYSYIISGCLGLVETWLNTGLQQSPKELAEIISILVKDSEQLWENNKRYQVGLR